MARTVDLSEQESTPSGERRQARGATSDRHRRDIQGLRGLAVLLVVVYHTGSFVTGGFVGVDIFFVISGFVITTSLLGEFDRAGRISLRAFYTRRIRRLLPALAVTLIVVAAISALALSPFGPQVTAAKTGLAGAVFASNLYLYLSPSGYFGAPAAVNPFLHIWSLSVEEQFYIAYPLILIGGWRLLAGSATAEQRRRRLSLLLAGVALASLAACIWLTELTPGRFGISDPARLAFYAPVTRAWQFLAGALIASAAPAVWRHRPRIAHAATILGLAMVLVAALSFSEFTEFPGFAALLPTIGAVALILGGGWSASGIGRRLFGWTPLVWLGDISYSWYLWHWPLIVAARMVWPDAGLAPAAAAIVSLAPALLSYRLVENRIRFSPAFSGRRVVTLAATCIISPLLALGGLRIGTTGNWGSSSIESTSSQLAFHADEVRGCSTIDALSAAACRWEPSGTSAGTVVLIGDSNAGHFTEAAAAAANDLGMTLIASTSSGCPFLALTMSRPGVGFDEACAVRVRAETDRLIAMRPAAVIIASASDLDLQVSDALRPADGSSIAVAPADKATAWAKALAATIGELTANGIKVLVVHPVPRFPEFDPPTRCTTAAALVDVAGCGASRPRSDILEERRSAFESERAAVTAGAGAASLDVLDDLCPGDPCRTHEGERWDFRDWAHISTGASLRLAPRFEAALAALVG